LFLAACCAKRRILARVIYQLNICNCALTPVLLYLSETGRKGLGPSKLQHLPPYKHISSTSKCIPMCAHSPPPHSSQPTFPHRMQVIYCAILSRLFVFLISFLISLLQVPDYDTSSHIASIDPDPKPVCLLIFIYSFILCTIILNLDFVSF
jgi:hypothetical protein